MNDANAPSRDRQQPPFNALWASAFVLFALVLIQAQGLFGAQPFGGGMAEAGVVSQTGPLTVMTSDGGNEDILVILDARSETVFVYRTDLKNGVQLFQRVPVPQLFVDARARSVGRN